MLPLSGGCAMENAWNPALFHAKLPVHRDPPCASPHRPLRSPGPVRLRTVGQSCGLGLPEWAGVGIARSAAHHGPGDQPHRLCGLRGVDGLQREGIAEPESPRAGRLRPTDCITPFICATMRAGATASPVTAEDFLYSWRRTLTPETGSEYAYHSTTFGGAKAFARARPGISARWPRRRRIRTRWKSRWKIPRCFSSIFARSPPCFRCIAPRWKSIPTGRPSRSISSGMGRLPCASGCSSITCAWSRTRAIGTPTT